MKLSEATLKKLRIIINGDETPDYRKGYELVEFFNELGFNDAYGLGFPSRWLFTEEKLKKINGTPEIEKCIRKAFAVVNFIGRVSVLDTLITDFNQYLAFDKCQVIRENDIITFKKIDKVIVDTSNDRTSEVELNEFLELIFAVDIESMNIDKNVSEIIRNRLKEIECCIRFEAPLASIVLIGSILEGLMYGTALLYPQLFNQATSAPKDKDTGKVKKFQHWSLNDFINASSELGILNQDVNRFSHVVRDFRNYIHPYEQMVSHFFPDKQTALICFQVLKATISQIGTFQRNQQGEQTR